MLVINFCGLLKTPNTFKKTEAELRATEKEVELRLQCCGFTCEDVDVLASLIMAGWTVSTVKLGSNEIEAEGAKKLVAAIARHPKLAVVDLSGNPIGGDGVVALIKSARVQNLDLGATHFDFQQNAALGRALAANKSIRRLELGGNNIGRGPCYSLAQALKENTTLRRLGLSDNQFDDTGIRVLASGLSQNQSLKSLALSHNKIGCRGMEQLAKAIAAHPALETLELVDCGIDDSSFDLLRAAVAKHPTLTSLNLSFNRLTHKSADPLSDLLQVTERLTVLSLHSNQLGPVGIDFLCEGIMTNTTLRLLDLSDNNLCNDGLKLAKAIQRNRHLHTFDMTGLSDGVKDVIEAALTKNQDRPNPVTPVWRGTTMASAHLQQPIVLGAPPKLGRALITQGKN